MGEFKAMKFMTHGDKDVQVMIHEALKLAGYKRTYDYRNHKEMIVFTELRDGDWYVNGYSTSNPPNAYLNFCDEINIDWMRKPKQEIVELNGKKYAKSDLEEALKHIKPVD